VINIPHILVLQMEILNFIQVIPDRQAHFSYCCLEFDTQNCEVKIPSVCVPLAPASMEMSLCWVSARPCSTAD
jgi:hypothetical protein